MDTHTRRLRVLGATVAFSLAALAATVAQVPSLISYQGQLNDRNGVPVNATVNFSFSLYNVATNGTALWTEAQTVPVSNGVFNVQLGAVQALPPVVFAENNLYLGIKVGADSEMTPRQRITSVVYARRAELAVPIGTILPWAKSLSGVPALWDGWVECNGQVLSDAGSPINGVTIPNLNGDGRVLKGAASSGAASDLSHSHAIGYWGASNGGNIQNMGANRWTFGAGVSVSPMWNAGSYEEQRRWNFTLENANVGNTYSVVWIMRVK